MNNTKNIDNIQKRLIKSLIIIAIVSFITMIFSVLGYVKSSKNEFIKPEFDNKAIAKELEITDELKELGYNEFYQEGMSYKFSMCGKVNIENKKATVYFTNDTNNETWLKLRIIDRNNNIIGETGIVRPGEYVENVDIKGNTKSGDKITLKIMGYVPEKYTSAGAVSVNTIIN